MRHSSSKHLKELLFKFELLDLDNLSDSLNDHHATLFPLE
jgi:hypothetical protein